MSLRELFEAFAKYRRATALLAIVTTFAGVALLLDRPKGTVLEWLSLPLMISGGSLFVWAVWPGTRLQSGIDASLASLFVRKLTLQSRLVPFFPALGLALILIDFIYNTTSSASPSFQTEDIIVLLMAGTLLGYGFIPTQFARERDFVFLFFLWLNAILVAPLLIARLYYADFEKSVDLYSWVALAPETNAVLNAIGVESQLRQVVGSTAPGLTFTPQHVAVQVTVVITTSCSGIYSFGIFAAAFIAFVLTESQRPSRRVWLLLGLGLLAAYAANVLRMVIIVLVGYYTDTGQSDLQNMLLAHSYAGWIIFLGWLVPFWGSLLKVLPPERLEERKPKQATSAIDREARCVACGNPLAPKIPAARCSCRAVYHIVCIQPGADCIRCSKPLSVRGQTTRGEGL